MEKTPVIVVVGPTAAGKTALSVSLAEQLNGEVISADSMQIYKGMDIATAKPSQEERRGVSHHLMGFLPPTETYSVAAFVRDARRIAADITARGKTLIVAGGTGLYTDSLIFNTVFEEEPDNTTLRQALMARLQNEGADALYTELVGIDSEIAAQIDKNNAIRLVRALEIWYLTGEKPSERRRRAVGRPSDFDPVWIGLNFRDRQLLYDRIERRADAMFEAGLTEEANTYLSAPNSATSAQAIGYKELAPYFSGEISLHEARERLIRATRRYAKRQITWFRRNPEISWIYRDEMTEQDIVRAAMEIIARHRTEQERN